VLGDGGDLAPRCVRYAGVPSSLVRGRHVVVAVHVRVEPDGGFGVPTVILGHVVVIVHVLGPLVLDHNPINPTLSTVKTILPQDCCDSCRAGTSAWAAAPSRPRTPADPCTAACSFSAWGAAPACTRSRWAGACAPRDRYRSRCGAPAGSSWVSGGAVVLGGRSSGTGSSPGARSWRSPGPNCCSCCTSRSQFWSRRDL
jgi:hypothetical protein